MEEKVSRLVSSPLFTQKITSSEGKSGKELEKASKIDRSSIHPAVRKTNSGVRRATTFPDFQLFNDFINYTINVHENLLQLVQTFQYFFVVFIPLLPQFHSRESLGGG